MGIENIPPSQKPVQILTATSSVLTSALAWLRKWWALTLGFLVSGLVGYAAVVWSSRKNGRAEVLTEQLRDTLKRTEQTKAALNKLATERNELVTKIAEVAAERTKALDENLTDTEVIKRLKEKGILKP